MYNNDFYDKFLRKMENLGKISIPDPDRYSRALEHLGKVSLPDPDRYSRALEHLGKISLPDPDRYSRAFEHLGKIRLPDPGRYSRALEHLGKIRLPDPGRYSRALEHLGKVNVPDFDQILSISEALSKFPDKISVIDWENFELTEENLKEANEILDSENAEEQVTEELGQKKDLKDSIKTIFIVIFCLVEFLNNLVDVANYAEEKLPPVIQAFDHYIVEGNFNSDREAIKWLNDELKKDTSQQIIQNFRIVTKDNLIVREGKKVNSKSSGRLNSGDVVQIIEKKRNWTYVHFSNYEDSEVIEGWVFTRYLKQIK